MAHRGLADHGGDVLIVDGVDLLARSANADLAEVHGILGTDNSVHVTAALTRSRWRRDSRALR